MTFSIFWSLDALREVTRLEKSAANPAAVRAAQDRIDYLLRRIPRDLGESRRKGYRLWYEDVLGVFYRIDDDAMRVDILFAGPARRR